MFNDSQISFPSLGYSDCRHHNHFSIFPAYIDFPPLKPFSEPDYFKAFAAVCSNVDLLFAFWTSLASSPIYLLPPPCLHKHHCSCRRTTVKALRLSGQVRMNMRGHLTELDIVCDISNFQKSFSPCKMQNDKVSIKDWQSHLHCYKC